MKKYLVLARKYRPQRFSEVVGQEAIVTTLKNALRFEKVAHAYLFCGSRGTGKTTLARLFAKALNCENLSTDCEPCNSCPSCCEIMNGQSLDVMEIDGASNRGIDDIRAINDTVGYAPTSGRYKIYIIDEVHMLTKEAFNALLKTLEEPPEKAKFFFATTEPHKILPTIISRCQRFDLNRILPSQIVAKLEEIAKDLSRTFEVEALQKIAELSDGAMRDAQSLFDQILCFIEGTITLGAVNQVFGLISQDHFFSLDQAFSEYRLGYAFELVETLFQAGKDLTHFFSQLIEHYRLIAVVKTLGEGALPPSATIYQQTARHYTQAQSLYILEYLIQAEATLSKTLSPRIFVEGTLLHILRSKHRIPVEVLVRRLSELETAWKGQIPELSAPPKKSVPESTVLLPVEHVQEMQPRPPLQKMDPASSVPPPAKLTKESQPTPLTQNIPSEPVTLPLPEPIKDIKHRSHYDTLMRFAAVELEGSLRS